MARDLLLFLQLFDALNLAGQPETFFKNNGMPGKNRVKFVDIPVCGKDSQQPQSTRYQANFNSERSRD